MRSLGARSKCVSVECADVPDVSNAERSGDLSNDSKSCGVSVAIDNVGHVFSNAIKFEEIVIYECHVQRLQSQFRNGREQKRNLQNDIRGQTARALRNESNQTSENTLRVCLCGGCCCRD